MNPVESHIILILEEPLKNEGFDLIEAKYAVGGKDGSTLSVVVDRVDPISLNDIVKVSELVSKILDDDDSFDEPYVLDVSSLGAEKPIALEKLDLYVGRYVNLHLITPYQGENYVEGTLVSVNGGTVELEYREKTKKKVASLARKDIDKARLAIEF
ncbi:MAG: ribosome maturation factor RimP [Bacilli bacterium]|nr:ribosome maturation factor RimP [Bacilli bacterium]